MTLGDNEIDALLNHYPGPMMIGASITRYLLAIACSGIFVVAGIWLILFEDRFAAIIATHHAPFRGEGFLYLLILLRVAHDMPQAIMELGWFAVILGGVGVFGGTLTLMRGVTGVWGLTLDRDGFIAKSVKGSSRHNWADVGDFDTLEVPKIVRRRLLARSCVMFNDYRAPESPTEWIRRAGRNRVLIGSYEYPAEVLAPAMSIWRERALRDRASRDR
jgi:hypothetical protein